MGWDLALRVECAGECAVLVPLACSTSSMKTHQLKQVLYLAYSQCPSSSRLRYLRFLRVRTKLPVSVGSALPNLNSVHSASIPYLHAAILGTAWVQEW